MFVRKKDAIEAHLTIVFTALAVARTAQNRSGLAIRNLIRQLRPLRSATIAINGAVQTFPPQIDPDRQVILDALNPGDCQALTRRFHPRRSQTLRHTTHTETPADVVN